MGQFDASKKFLSAQLSTRIPVIVQIVTTALHFGWCHVFIYKYNMREVGAAIATNITATTISTAAARATSIIISQQQ